MTLTAAGATSLARDLEAIVGADHVADVGGRFAIDGIEPCAVVTPGDTAEVAAVLRYANQNRLVVVPAGGMSHQYIGGIPERIDIVLRTTRLTKIDHYDPGDLTIGVGAGMTIADLNATIGAHQQVLPTGIAHAAEATVGGLLATNLHGPMKHVFGGARDWLIGVRFITADGKIAKAGGRVVKNVAGYDLMKLLIGSYGTLAVIVGASFKLFPAPRRTRTYVCRFTGADQALEFRSRIMHSPLSPLALELVSPHAQVIMSGDAQALHQGWRVLLRAAGSDAVLARYRAENGDDAVQEIDDDAAAWRPIIEFPATIFAHSPNAMLARLDLPPTEIGAALQAAERAATANNFVLASVGRAGIGAMLLAFCPMAVDPPGAIQYANTISDFRGSLSRHASAVVLRCPVEAKRHFSVWGTSPTDLDAMRAIKRALDPNDVLNRGRFLV
jgi:glycolate oxidase FAD binding subunit